MKWTEMGIYVHIPFCRSKCFYCGFYSTASLQLKEAFLSALKQEIDLRKNYLPCDTVSTLYFGGGTPSYLSVGEVASIIRELEGNYQINSDIEWTIEMNPEDMNEDKLLGLLDIGFNRLSVGIQSFDNDILKKINRTHTAGQAIRAVELAASTGFKNIGIDLIIGLHGDKHNDLEKELNILKSLPVTHVSVYMLSIEPRSVLERQVEKGIFVPLAEDLLAEEYLKVCELLKGMGFEHYEISNFAKDGCYSKHNTSYWQQKPYIGFGPSAHSYDLHSRQWNTASLKTYIDSLNKSQLDFEKEILTDVDRYNEYLMTSLRTMWGINRIAIEKEFPDLWRITCRSLLKYVEAGYIQADQKQVWLTEKGWLISDTIFADLFA